jgi:NAD(P)-dependent dehydrogenase (short-subunit alcohol dehydrogenase family)
MPGRLDGKVAVITGGTSGIGEATARMFAAEGARIVIAGRSEQRGNALSSELGQQAVFFRADVMTIATPIFWGGSTKAQTMSAEDNARKLAKLEGNLARATPLPRSGVANDIAYAAVFLASDEGSFINAHDLVVDGGRISQFFERPPPGT